MNKALTKFLGITAIATSLAVAGTASAVPISTSFNIAALGNLLADTGSVLTATTITNGAPNVVGFIQTDNTGLVAGQSVIFAPAAMGVVVGNIFTKTWTTALGTFVETLTVTNVTLGTSSRGVLATGTIHQTAGTGFDDTPAFYSASYTQNQGPGTQINGSFNNSTTPPPPTVPEPATLALLGLGLAALGFARRKQA